MRGVQAGIAGTWPLRLEARNVGNAEALRGLMGPIMKVAQLVAIPDVRARDDAR